MTGPRSRADAAPQWMGKRPGVPAPGCEVSRICPLRLLLMVRRGTCRAPEMRKGLRRHGAERKASREFRNVGRKACQCKRAQTVRDTLFASTARVRHQPGPPRDYHSASILRFLYLKQ